MSAKEADSASGMRCPHCGCEPKNASQFKCQTSIPMPSNRGRECRNREHWQHYVMLKKRVKALEQENAALRAQMARKAKPASGKCKTCSGYGWITSGVGHYGEQEGGHKDVMARCEHCLGLGFIERGEV